MKKIFTAIGVSAGLVLFPVVSLAATVTASITAPMGGRSYTVTGEVTSMTLSNSELQVTLGNTETLTVTSPGNTKLVFDKATVPPYTETCSATSYSVTFTHNTTTAKTITISPSETTCVVGATGGGGSGSGSGGGGGGGGGGSSVSPLTSTTPTPAPTPGALPAAMPAAPSTQAAVSPFGITSDLSLGSKSNEVSQLQAYLAGDEEVYPEGKITGYFGVLTKAAVQRFQKKYGLPAVGRVGPLTRAKLAEVFGGPAPLAPAPAPAPSPAPSAAPAAGASFTRALEEGVRGDDVTALQQILAGDPAVYPEGLVTGYFGNLTEKAVQRFQEKYGIANQGDAGYGYVGPKTRTKLNELLGAAPAPAPAPSAPADDAAKILELQDQLKKLQDQLKVLQGQ